MRKRLIEHSAKIELKVNGYRIWGDEESVCFDNMTIDSNDGFEYTWEEILHIIKKDFDNEVAR